MATAGFFVPAGTGTMRRVAAVAVVAIVAGGGVVVVGVGVINVVVVALAVETVDVLVGLVELGATPPLRNGRLDRAAGDSPGRIDADAVALGFAVGGTAEVPTTGGEEDDDDEEGRSVWGV